MSEDEEIMVQRILGLLRYNEMDDIERPLLENLQRAYRDIERMQEFAQIGALLVMALERAQKQAQEQE